MISDDKVFEYVTKRISDHSNDTEAGLKLFIPMFSAILGGSIWLRLQIAGEVQPSYKYLSNALMILLTSVCIAIVLDNLRAWWNFRKELHKITADATYPQSPPRICTATFDFFLCISMLVACLMFICFNPFSLPK